MNNGYYNQGGYGQGGYGQPQGYGGYNQGGYNQGGYGQPNPNYNNYNNKGGYSYNQGGDDGSCLGDCCKACAAAICCCCLCDMLTWFVHETYFRIFFNKN